MTTHPATLYTRAEYMDATRIARESFIKANPDATDAQIRAAMNEVGMIAHRRYYGQFVNERTIKRVITTIGAVHLLRSTDPHLNDIPLGRWDRCAQGIPIAMALDAAGDYMTLGGGVCIAKEAARQWLESQQKGE